MEGLTVRRFQSRRSNGRFQRNTLENTFGLKAWVCIECRRFIPLNVGEPKPETCPHCEKPFKDISEAPNPLKDG